MRNLILGILIGISGSYLFYMDKPPAWYVWILFAAGCALLVFGFDVLFGSLEERESRAAFLGFGLFGGVGVILLLVVFGISAGIFTS